MIFYRINELEGPREYAKQFFFETPQEARQVRETAVRTLQQRIPKGAYDAEVSGLTGPSITTPRLSPTEVRAQVAEIRRAVAAADGPLFHAEEMF